ncbi:leucine-rich repeat domain-containing protein, partial [bacterium]|nr:leucine-rich repeat domain-containing protein [bacterium]
MKKKPHSRVLYYESSERLDVPWLDRNSNYHSFADGKGEVELKNGITEIPGSAFFKCSAIMAVVLPDSIERICISAFQMCRNLKSVVIPDSVKDIEEFAFSDCSSLSSLFIPASVSYIEDTAFWYCSALTSIVVDKNNEYYDSRDNCNAIIDTNTSGLFLGCMNTVIPDSVECIDYPAFFGCTGLKSIFIPASVIIIQNAFDECTNLASIVVDKNNEYYDSRDNCNAIIKTAGNTLLAGCKETVIPESVKVIGNGAFCGCRGIKNMVIPDSVKTIENGAFCGCSNLESIVIPKSVTTIGENIFNRCDSLVSIKVDKNNPKYDSRDNCNAIIETDTNVLITGCRSTVIPDSVTEIGFEAFHDCTSLKSMIIPDSVKVINFAAFHGCSEMTSVTIPDSVV